MKQALPSRRADQDHFPVVTLGPRALSLMRIRHPIPNSTPATLIEPPQGIKIHGMLMDRVFEGHGIRFEYPEDWILHEQSSPDELTLTVHSAETSFWSLTLLFDRPDPRQVIDSVLETFRQEYSEIDVYPSDVRLNDLPTEACELDFVCHDLIGSAFLRAVAASDFTLLVLYQAADLELDETQPVLEKLTRSLSWTTDEPPQEDAWMEMF